MQINNEILQDFIYCKYKAYKKSRHQQGYTSEYQTLYNQLKQNQTNCFEKKLLESKELLGDNSIFDNATVKEGISLKLKFANPSIDLTLDGVEFTGKKNIIPIFITPFEKITKSDKLFVALQATYIQKEFNLQIDNCKVIHSAHLKKTRFKLAAFVKTTRKIINELNKILSSSTPPVFLKNPHCQVCEFRGSCLQKLIERDDLSLLAGLKPNEIVQKNNRGIFSVKQLSYLFRPKKNPYQKRKFLPELKALAIREGKTFIQVIPSLKPVETEVFLDFEGIMDRDFNYLIGAIIRNNNIEKGYSFWADSDEAEAKIFIELINLLKSLGNFTIYHYGSYETKALKKISKKLPQHHEFLNLMLSNSFNLLNVFIHGVYPPTYSNGLKEIARFLKFDWTEKEVSGLQSTIWRYLWESTHNDELKQKLIKYNFEDCKALVIIYDWLRNIMIQKEFNIEQADNIPYQSPYKWGKAGFKLKDMEEINSYAYFEYQRTRVFFKTYPEIKKPFNPKKESFKSHKSLKPNKIVQICLPSKCTLCSSESFYKHDNLKKVVIDIKISRTGIKRFITQYESGRFRCKKCNNVFTPENFKNIPVKYGRTLYCWIINNLIKYRNSYRNISDLLKENFCIQFSGNNISSVKSQFAKYYKSTYHNLMEEIVKGKLLHVDETPFSISKSKGYVWAFTNMDTIYYYFTITRQSDFLKELISEFKGVLVSDFYAGYDSVNCVKQRCLIHLIRDINDDILKNQLNVEFIGFASTFSNLLNEIMSTVNKFGLKKRFLNKHINSVNTFFKELEKKEFNDEICERWQKRFLLSKNELFTFLNYDGIPWNNNNAEVAIKAVALYRKNIEGLTTKKGITDYLRLLSIQQTCKYRGINFFEFLKSGETNISNFSGR